MGLVMSETEERSKETARAKNYQGEITIPHNPELDLFVEALTSPVFQARVDAGVKRLIRHRAESGFSIISNTGEIIYPRLNLGGRHPESEYEQQMLGHRASTQTHPQMSEKWFMAHRFSTKGYSVIASFHFHPSNWGFSQHDMEHYDRKFERTTLEEFPFNPAGYNGVFIPQWQGKELPSIKLLMFAGLPTEHYYQSADFKELTLPKQKDILEKSGMKVILVDLPVVNGHTDLNSLRSAISLRS